MNREQVLTRLGIKEVNAGACSGTEWLISTGQVTESASPIDGKPIAKIQNASIEEYEQIMARAQQAFKEWRKWPAPQRGEVVRQLGDALRENKKDLGALVSLEMGKI
ncbi:MAG: aldehyde dehydrogenase family protein, partial [Bacteroidales bacterium]|nr:aldehyde dehydrogenase family protein [Bacteroidales bacterium]